MKITVLGGGAMGGLFGGYLSLGNDVTVIDVNRELVRTVEERGLLVAEPDGGERAYYPHAACDSAGMEPADLVLVFVKAMYSEGALRNSRNLIGPETYLMTLQNGSGHEDTLLKFTDARHVIIGTTQHNAKVERLGVVRHGGSGPTKIGLLSGSAEALADIAETFSLCGISCAPSDEVRRMIWDKLFTNVSASVLTGVLQCPLGFIRSNPDAWSLCEELVAEAVAVAGAEGVFFDCREKLKEVAAVCQNSPAGITSICADLKAGRSTEVDTISGSVVRAGERAGVDTPGHRFMVRLVHAMEERQKNR